MIASARQGVFIQKLADLEFQPVAHLDRATFTAIETLFFPVMGCVDNIHHTITAKLRQRIATDIPPAVFRLQIIQLAQGGDVHANAIAALGDVIDDLNRCGAILPVKCQIVIVKLKVIFLGMTITGAIRKTGYQGIAAIKLNDRLKLCLLVK